MQVDFTRLRYFVAVAEELHFRRAADRLMITPPPLSKQIKLLENELGGALFERDYHNVRLTPLGESLLEPARDILTRVDQFALLATRITKSANPIRIGATAYAPSDFLAKLETAVGTLPAATEFSVPGSAAEVTAKLVSGHLDIGLIHLPTSDKRLRHRVVASYPGAIAVRYDDPLAAADRVGIEALRDRDVVIDFARPNPVVLAGLTRSLHARGVDRIVRTTNQLGGELEMATQVFNRHLVAVVTYAPASAIGRIFSPPEFKLIPIDESNWAPVRIALAWVPDRQTRPAEIAEAVEQIADAVGAPDAAG
ncbi:LysR family transcriptional regulator [Mycolicibacterium diernhoferi]|uniref:Probable hydrogen peroxide-inducible genes activator n=1 Tax=Mycolicibacterium diernhoferi TaxID=1801 RepID=A0A1Q4HA52_9MYCO|nr:LysR family transcriptional regulator [Mycolicibacterium diernhoferi]OJZ64410.1 LysR family transcriptional regulator [Mycolicibacterium diernhoferi]OPE55865.1 LysR family transcriptional regulator [Mycolicibacterium diernhoferi]PEG53389.1 LysR family transcriptional regulator [Mycolicibacterium diernhoferi]QYL24230.1 LysR family transcriptional regulator [Mycolicibacterium diernhoferi]